MKVWVFTVVKDAAELLPFFFRHYAFADRIVLWDDDSTDGSRDLYRHYPNVDSRNWPHPGSGINEDLFLQFAYDHYPEAAGLADWAIWVDPDEFIYHPKLLNVLEDWLGLVDVIKPYGYNMICDGFPKDDGRQIWEVCATGVRSPVYSKPVIFNPSSAIRWNRGKHGLECTKPTITIKCTGIKLLHYRYLGYEYTKLRNERNYERCGPDKGAAWSCAPTYSGEHSAQWARAMLTEATNVI